MQNLNPEQEYPPTKMVKVVQSVVAQVGEKKRQPGGGILGATAYYLKRFFKEKYILLYRDKLPVSSESE